MERTFYEVLGVGPASDEAAIRAAYRALMRRHHPDADPSTEAARRAKEINAAYAVLSDPQRRARYDGTIEAQRLIRPDPVLPRRTMRSLLPRAGPAAATLFSTVAAGLVAVAVWPPLAQMAGFPLAKSDKEEAHNRMPMKARSEPPAEAVRFDAQPVRPSSSSQPEEIVSKPAPPKRQVSEEPKLAQIVRAPAPAVVVRRVPKPRGAQKPLPSCHLGGGDTDKAICASANLTALDRQASLLYSQSWKQASEAKRTALLVSRASFNERRSMCETESCLTSAYVARLREISDIMAGRRRQP